jgi:methylenetetrahydrofolate reductase (NADPH)
VRDSQAVTRIDELLRAGPRLSVELWPPRSEGAARRLDAALEALLALRPAFASITYGAGGSTRERTHDLVVRLQEQGRTTPMAHLVCAAHSRRELVEILSRYRRAGVENVLALRGDPPLDASGPLPEGELRHAVELAVLAKEVGDFCVAVAAHPEGHPDSPDLETDRRHLAEKLRVADVAITQFFFRVEDYLRLVDDLGRRGVGKPVVPGVMPIVNARTVKRMAELSGAEVPSEVARRVERVADRPEEVRRVGVEVATELCARLLEEGVPGLHFYTMNDVAATTEIVARLGFVDAGGRDPQGSPT